MSHVTDAFAVLFRHAEDRLTLDELDELSSLAGAAGEEAQNLSQVCEGLAGIVVADGSPEGRGAGNFQESDSVAYLLSHLAHSLDVISGMIDAGQAAQHRANVLRGQEVAK
ncbi:hypothetical protein [Zoogloea sp.]|uniref:hypothetical protein n=1 Tax=Zoogloea sp. TaxID=49181 RepID=UPI00141673B4|nr:MAG: hypothetical protein F9K15_10460 [Zoogloea sp.]